MNTKFFLAVLTSTVIAFFGGWLLFGILFMDYYSSSTSELAKTLMKSPSSMWGIAISNIAWALLITWVLQKTRSTSMMKGFMTSLWVSFLISVAFDVSIYSFWNIYNIRFIMVDITLSTLFWGIIGGVSGAILGSGQKVMTKATS